MTVLKIDLFYLYKFDKYGQTNFFYTGDDSKILFPSMGFSYPGNSKKKLSSWGVLIGAGGLLAHFGSKNDPQAPLRPLMTLKNIF